MAPLKGIEKLIDLYKNYFGCLSFSKLLKDKMVKVFRTAKKKLVPNTSHTEKDDENERVISFG